MVGRVNAGRAKRDPVATRLPRHAGKRRIAADLDPTYGCFSMIAVREETDADRGAVRAVVEVAFGGTAEADLVDALRADGDAALSLVAEEAGVIVGHVMLSVLDAPAPFLALAPLSVTPLHQRRGYGGRLVRAASESAAERGWQGILVLGNPDYYGRFGFSAEPARGFECRYAGDHLLFKALGCGGVARGRIGYPPAFARLET